MLRKGLVHLHLSWYGVLFGTLPFASLFLLAASAHYDGGVSPTVTSFLRILPSFDWRGASTGAPLRAPNFSLLSKFLADTTALGIPFNVRDVLLPLTSSLVRVGFGKHSEWDSFYRWIIDATH